MKRLLFALALVALLGGLGLGLSASAAQASTIHYCDLEDNGATEIIARGDDILLDLGSGYTWKATVVDPYGHPVLQKVWLKNGHPTVAYFHSIGAGQSIIRARGIANCWPNCDVPPVREFSMAVVVQ